MTSIEVDICIVVGGRSAGPVHSRETFRLVRAEFVWVKAGRNRIRITLVTI